MGRRSASTTPTSPTGHALPSIPKQPASSTLERSANKPGGAVGGASKKGEIVALDEKESAKSFV